MGEILRKIALSDEDMETISGGVRASLRGRKKKKTMKVACIHCQHIMDVDTEATIVTCPDCQKINTFAG